MKYDLTKGNIMKTMLLFAVPMMVGNLLQQCYNVADTLIVGRFLGSDAVGSSYTLMTFLTSIVLGLCMGSGAYFSILYGKKDESSLKQSFFLSFLFILSVTVFLNIIVFLWIDPLMRLLQIPVEIYHLMRSYLWIIFMGITATFLYNYFASLLRAIGNSWVPLYFLGLSALLNIFLDLLFVIFFHWGVEGAAYATIIAQYISGVGLAIYTWYRFPELRPQRQHCFFDRQILSAIFQFSCLTCIQQSMMNLGILMVQGRVNSFGTSVMAAFAAGVKIDSFAYMPVQDFGNAFSTFVAQNYGARQIERIKKGMKYAFLSSLLFCALVSFVVCVFAKHWLMIFIDGTQKEIIDIGIQYLRIEGSFYGGIGCLFLFYGLYRALSKPGMSVILTIFSLGTRVLLAYGLSSIPSIGVLGIWVSVPIGWILADLVGALYFYQYRHRFFEFEVQS